MENEAGGVGVVASIIHTCGRRGSCKQQEAWAGAGVRHCGSRLEGFLSSASPGRLPGVALCEAGPKGGSAYLADWSGRRPQRIGATSWQGSTQHCPIPELLPAKRGQAGRKSMRGPRSESGLSSAQTQVSKLSVCSCKWPTLKCVAVSLLGTDCVFMCLCVPLHTSTP